MLAAIVFIASVIGFFFLTVIVPTIPPGEIMQAFLEIPEIASPIPQVSGVVFTNALINGLFWGTALLIIYTLITRRTKKKILQHKWRSNYTLSRLSPPEYVPPKTFVKKPVATPRKDKTHASLDKKIETIEGIGSIYGRNLRRAGITSIDDLLRAGSTRRKRYYLAKKVGVSPSTVLRWICRADLFRVSGIGKQYSSLLESAGVNSVANLSKRNPHKLYQQLIETNWEKNMVKRTPPLEKVKDWVENAKTLKQLVVP